MTEQSEKIDKPEFVSLSQWRRMYHSWDPPPSPTKKAPTQDEVNDQRIDALQGRFRWLENESETWKPSRKPPPYHLRTKPKIKCRGCLSGELGQLAHMDEPSGCLYTPITPIYFCKYCTNLVDEPEKECGKDTCCSKNVDYVHS